MPFKQEVLKTDGTDEAIQRVETTWAGTLPAEVKTTWVETNQVSLIKNEYGDYENLSDRYEYAWSASTPGALLRRTHTDYKTDGYDSHTGPLLRHLPTVTTVYNATGTRVAQTELRYDETPLTQYGAVTGWSDPGTQRGNPTTTRRWLNTLDDGDNNTATNNGGYLEARAEYDQVGNVVKSTDARGATSEVEYAADYHYAYPTKTTSAVPDPSEVSGSKTPLVTTTAYDLATGLVTSSVDANNQTTSYEYQDPLDRPTKVTRPDGGWTTYGYGRNQYGDYVETRAALDCQPALGCTQPQTQARTTYTNQFFDGLGRAVRSFSSWDGTTYTTIDTEYDALGRVSRVSRPYRSTGSAAEVNAAGLWTTTSYDALGRVTAVTTPDGATLSTSYSGNQVSVTDQAGKRRRSITDALGRLTQVVEAADVAGYGYVSSFDALGNLRQVSQGAQTRTFGYDSLGRLTSATNPESGTLAYTYDANSNLLTRTDARGITTTYGYDAVNRNTTVRYSDSTPGINRSYDSAVNGRGRWRADWTLTTGGIYQTHHAVDKYDAAGRQLDSRQYFYVEDVAGGLHYHTPL